MRRALPLVPGVIALLIAVPAMAQSKRYPAEPIDKDRAQAEHSALWENATNPRHEPYRKLVAEAKVAVTDRTDDQYRVAVQKLDQAISLLPDHEEAYLLRGEAHLLLGDWAGCAADLQTAAAKAPRGEATDPNAATPLRRTLGMCLARAGKLADAERVLAEAAMSGTGTGDMLMRLGEVRIAMGKLDEAVAALTAALEARDLPSQALAHWLLASAYDRARRPAEAIVEARRAAGFDRSFSALTMQPIPLLGAGEAHYLLGLAWEYGRDAKAMPRPENAIVHFRTFLELATASPWRKRAEDHLRELQTASLPEAIERKGGSAELDLDATRALVRRSMPAMRACLANTPRAVLEVTITRSGPRTKRPATRPRRDGYRGPRARFRLRRPMPPPDGVSVTLVLDLDDTPRAATDAAIRCVEPLANRIARPSVKEQDAWYKIGFLVVSP